MNYNKDFNKLVDKCIIDKQYVGLGNPNAKILFVGKEAGMPIDSELIHGSSQLWKENKVDYSNRFIPEGKKLRNGNHTWQKYQRLYNLILDKLNICETISKKDLYEISFVENVFTTELSNLPAPRTSDAKKQRGFKTALELRKEIFWNSPFISKFPIILIFATDNKYIETYRGEVCKLFDVEYFEQIICAKTDKLSIHYSAETKNNVFPKLVIHTRQLTNGASNELLEKIADVVRDFIKKYDIKIKVK